MTSDKICYLIPMNQLDVITTGQGSAAAAPARRAPPILAGSLTPEVHARVENFYGSVAAIFDRWVRRCRSPHTQRSYRDGVMSFTRYLGLVWPAEAPGLLAVTIADVQNYRDWLIERGAAPKTLNHRVSALSSFYRYLGLCSAELRLPVIVPNPAHAQFIARASSDARDETLALPAARARQLLTLPAGDGVMDYRDRAIMKLYLYTGIRLAAGCRLEVGDFRQDGEEATLRLQEKGDKRRIIGLHYAAAQAVREYVDRAGIASGPLFRAQRHARVAELGTRAMNPRTMWSILKRYLGQLPNGRPYTPHSLRATAATLLLDSGVDIMEVKELLGHRHVTTTQIYDKRRRSAREGASHKMPL